MLSVGAGHKLGVVLNRPVRHHDQSRLAVAEDFRAIAALSTVVRRNEHADTLEEFLHVWVLEQGEPSGALDVASENERDVTDIEEGEQAQVVCVGERRVIVVKELDPAGQPAPAALRSHSRCTSRLCRAVRSLLG